MEENKFIKYKVLIIDVLIYLVSALAFVFTFKNIFVNDSNLGNNAMGIYIPLFIFIFVGIVFCIFVEYKFNNLKIRNIFFYIGLAIALFSVLSAIIVPNNYHIYFGQTIAITTNDKLYACLRGIILGILLIAYFYLIPRKILSKRFLNFVFLLLLSAAYIFIIASFFTDGKNYIEIIKSSFQDSSHPIASIAGHKNLFAQILFVGLSSSIILWFFNKNIKWALLGIPCLIILPFSFSKITIFLAIILLFTILIIKLIPLIKKSKENAYIAILIVSFITINIIVFSILISKSESGFIFNIKKIFINFFEHAKDTFNSRLEIWRCSFLALNPIQYIFGCGGSMFNKILHFTYLYNPNKVEDPTHLWHSHNAFIEQLGEGGIILVLINISLYIYLFWILNRLYKKNKSVSSLFFCLLIISIIIGMFEPYSIISGDHSIYFNFITVVPIMTIYYWTYDKNEINERLSIINNAKYLNDKKFNNYIMKLNIIHVKKSAKNIKETNKFIKN